MRYTRQALRMAIGASLGWCVGCAIARLPAAYRNYHNNKAAGYTPSATWPNR